MNACCRLDSRESTSEHPHLVCCLFRALHRKSWSVVEGKERHGFSLAKEAGDRSLCSRKRRHASERMKSRPDPISNIIRMVTVLEPTEEHQFIIRLCTPSLYITHRTECCTLRSCPWVNCSSGSCFFLHLGCSRICGVYRDQLDSSSQLDSR